ncbi:MAG: S9 family peptidase [Polyangiaceae bacterium]|nr:S9 family peptidase [Polyangiaceae bacterium]
MQTKPYGTWDSPITPEQMARGGARLAFPDVLEGGEHSWIEGRPSEGGRYVPVRTGQRDVPAPFSARTRVYEYGGRAHLVIGDVTYFVDGPSGKLVKWSRNEATTIGEASGYRLADLTHDVARDRLIAVGEQAREGKEPENGLVSVSLVDGVVRWIAQGHDFYASPAISPDGKQLAYLAWDHPYMAWDAATLYLADIAEDGSLSNPRAICGGPEGSAFQPTWSPSGDLFCGLEVGERWSLHRIQKGRAELVADAGVEIGAPLWNLGTRLFGFIDAHTVIGTGLWDGSSRVVRIDVGSGAVETLTTELRHIGELACRGDKALFLCGWAGGGTRLVEMDLGTRSLRVVRNALEGAIDPADISTPEAISYPTSGGATAHANFYPPKSSRFTGPANARPPVVVVVHGGPTGCANNDLVLSIQFFTTRGFAVLDVNYRGSTGFGRSYREALRGRWGELDVDDCVAGVRFLAEHDRIDPTRAIIRGGSAGGYTVLQALTDHDVFRAAACHYGVSDPASLSHDTHKFEKHYDAFLFGSGEARKRAFETRTPIRKVDRIRAPVIFFQGLEDPAVVPAQTEGIYLEVRARGIDTEYHG